MQETWTYSKVSTPERCLEKISKELPWPVGIMIFGADQGLKEETERLCVKKVPYLIGGEIDKECGVILRGAEKHLRKDRNVVIILDEKLSCNHELRHQIVTNLRQAGAKSVVGMYVESTLMQPPTADGLEALIMIPKEGAL